MSDAVMTRVLRGADWLSDHYPGWWDHIDLMSLDIASGDRCVLAQVFGALPADQQNRMQAQVMGQGDCVPTFNGRLSGYSVMVFFHDLGQAGMPWGFWQGFPFAPTGVKVDDLNQAWINVIISYRLANADLDQIIESAAVPA